MPRGYHYRGSGRYSRKTFKQAAAKWINEWDGQDKERQALAIEQLLPYIGPLPLYKVNNAALEDFKEERSKSVMASTVNKELVLVTTIMNVAADIWEWIDYVPKIRGVKGPVKSPHPLTWDEQDLLFARLPDWWAKGPALFAVNTGARMGEVVALRWDHLTPFMKGYIAVVDGKNGQERAVVCNHLAALAIDRQKGNENNLIFPSRSSANKGGMITRWQGVFSRAWEMAGLAKGPLVRKGAHNLRHTFGHRHSSIGTPESDIRLLLGHANANITQHYAQPDLERLMKHSERITERPNKPEILLRSVRSRV